LDGGFERGDVVDIAGDDLDAFCNQCLTQWLAGVTRCAADCPGGVFEEGGGDGTALVATVSAYIFGRRRRKLAWLPVIPIVTIVWPF
jgi:hypothetical protein